MPLNHRLFSSGALAAATASLALGSCLAPRSSSEFEVLLYPASLVAPSDVVVYVSHPTGSWTLKGADFTTTQYAVPHSGKLAIPTDGVLTVEVLATKTPADTVAIGSLSIPLRADMRYGVAVHVAAANPAPRCVGCNVSLAFPLRGSLAARPDSLFLAYSELPKGTVM